MSDNQSGGIKNILNVFQSGVDRVQVTLQKSGNSTFYPTTLSVQHSQKSGWLRKQGGVVKSWKRRWFTLKGDQLYYYLTEDESKTPQGMIPLAGNNVVELPLNPGKSDEFIFEIVPGGDKQKMSTTHDTYPICASCEDERKAWTLVIRQIMFSKIGGAIFGQSLSDTLFIEHRHRKKRKTAIQKKVPEIVETCVDFLMTNGLETEGIFRLPGRTSLIRELKEEFDMGRRPALDASTHDVQTIASLLKLYLRELPEPIIPRSSYESVMKIVNRDFHEDPDKAVERLAEEMGDLPPPNYNLLQYLCKFLHEVAQHSDVNKMTEMNLATVFVHAVIRPEDEDPALLMATASGRTQTVFVLINKHAEMLSREYMPDGGAVVTENLLEVDDLMESKPFNANQLALYSVLDSASGQSMTEEILDLTHLNNNNLPQPLAPLTHTDPHNRRGSRKGRLFRDSGAEAGDERGEDEDDYALIVDIPPPTRKGREQAGGAWNQARSRQGASQYIEGGQGASQYTEGGQGASQYMEGGQGTSQNTGGAGDGSQYSGEEGGQNPSLRDKPEENEEDTVDGRLTDPLDGRSGDPLDGRSGEVVEGRLGEPVDKRLSDPVAGRLCESVSSIEEDYTTLADYTSDYSALLRKKSSEMYTGEEEGGRRGAGEGPDSEQTATTHQPEHPPPDTDDLYRKVVKPAKKAPPTPREDPTTDYDNIVPPVPPKRPIPNPRNSLSRNSVIVEATESKHPPLKQSASVDTPTNGRPPLPSRGSHSDYQSINDLRSLDCDTASREELISHIHVLQGQLVSTKEKHRNALQKFAQKLNSERTATQEAVSKVMSLQTDIQKYQLKYGPLQ